LDLADRIDRRGVESLAESTPRDHLGMNRKQRIELRDSDIDWMACELIEAVPGKVSGRPIVRGTRIMPDAIVDSYDLGETIEELVEGFPALTVSQIKRLIEFAHAQRGIKVA
jgi:uncharacterized protein (DUF433 family)